MIYCQDCGAANDVAGTICRICGRALATERGSGTCPACGQPIADPATFCSSCGVTILQATASQPAHNFAFAGATSDGVGLHAPPPPLNPAVQTINESLELPDWLRRAATEQPHDASQATDSSFMYTGVNPMPPAAAPEFRAPQPANGTVWPAPPQPEPSITTPAQASALAPPNSIPQPSPAPSPAPEQSLWPSQVPPTLNSPAAPSVSAAPAVGRSGSQGPARKIASAEISSGGLDQSLPSWLNQPPQAQPDAAAPSNPPTPVAPPTDTTSFISESDLPAWIRQLAEAEEQRKAQETAASVAAAAAAVVPAPQPLGEAPRPDQDLFGEGSLDHRISQLPGEAEPPAVTSSPWFNGNHQPPAPQTIQADVWSRPGLSSVRTRIDEEDAAQPVATATAYVQPEPAQMPVAAEESEETNTLRFVLMVLAVASVVALAAYLYLIGGR